MSEVTVSEQFLHLGRRELLVSASAAAAALAAVPAAAGAAADIVPASASAYPASAFSQKSEADALKAMFGKESQPSTSITLDAPEIAENGAVVPVSVNSTLPNVTAISILATDNPFTMAAAYKIPAGTSPAISSRIKLAKTTDVIAVVESDGKLFTASRTVKVTLGGCG
jgi:sulfur-oxidizing protein SoxY